MDIRSDQLAILDDGELLAGLHELATSLRVSETRLLAYLNEVEERRLFARQGFPSLFAFAVEVLKFAEGAACRRIAAARAARIFPEIYAYLADGRLHVTGVAMLAPHLKAETCTDLLARAARRTKRELEVLLAELAPKPDAADLVRRLPSPAPGPATCGLPSSETPLFAAVEAASPSGCPPLAEPVSGSQGACDEAPGPASPTVQPPPGQVVTETRSASGPESKIQPLSPGRSLIRFTASDEIVKNLERARELLAHKYPTGQLADVIGEALEALIDQRDLGRRIARKKARAARKEERGRQRQLAASSTKTAAPTPQPPVTAVEVRKPATRSRYIPVAVDEAAWEESQGRCTYVSPDGRRCNSRWLAQRDHAQPFALGGSSVDPHNIRYRCFVHNILTAVDTFGPLAVQSHATASGGSPFD